MTIVEKLGNQPFLIDENSSIFALLYQFLFWR